MAQDIQLNTLIAETIKPGWNAMTDLLGTTNIQKILSIALGKGGEFAKICAEYSITNGLTLEENKIRQAQSGITQGIGIRVIRGEKTGYAYSERFELKALESAAKTASFIADQASGNFRKIDLKPVEAKNHSPILIYPSSVDFKKRGSFT